MINIGISVGKKRCAAAIMGDAAGILGQTEFYNTPDGIGSFAKYVKDKYGGQAVRAVCAPTGNYWTVLHDTLEEHGIDTLLMRATREDAAEQADLGDAGTDPSVLADLLRTGGVRESFVPDRYHRDLRSLSRDRMDMIRLGAVEKSRILYTMEKYGYDPPANGVLGRRDIESLRRADVSEADRMSLDMRLDVIEVAARHRAALEDRIESVCRDEPGIRLLMTIPGISRVDAVGIFSEIVDIRRFATAKKFAAYAGIAPPRRNNGGTARTGPPWLHHALVDVAAAVALRDDGGMREKYERISANRGKQKARVAVARTLATVIWHMLTRGTEY